MGEGVAGLAYAGLDELLAAWEAAFADLMNQVVDDGAALCPPVMQVRLVGTKEPEALRYRPTLIDPYRDHLRTRRVEGPAVPVQQLFREIKELGYTGSLNLLHRYITHG